MNFLPGIEIVNFSDSAFLGDAIRGKMCYNQVYIGKIMHIFGKGISGGG